MVYIRTYAKEVFEIPELSNSSIDTNYLTLYTLRDWIDTNLLHF